MAIAKELGGSGGGKGGFAQMKVDAGRVDDLLRRLETHVRDYVG